MRERSLYGGCQRREPGGESGGECLSGQYLSCGFVYCVSSLGVTGTRTQITTDIGGMVKLVKAVKDIPCAVGFGISTPEQAKKMAAQSDGAIVGSAIVKLCAAHGENCVPYVKEYVKSMKDAVREA